MSNFKKKRIFWIVVTVVTALVIFRLALPFIVLRYANKTLADMDGYYGRIQDIDIALIRGAYKIDSVYINKVDSVTREQTPFFSASVVDLSIEWKALFHGSFVGEFVFENPTLIFTREKVEPSTLKKDSSKFEELQDDFMPLRVNRFEINRGNIRYIDNSSKPNVDIAMTNVYILAQNLRNSYDSAKLLPATVEAEANVYGGTVKFNMKMNPLADVPLFDLNTELKNTNLVELNEFFQAYAKVDVNKGSFGMYAEIAAKDGSFKGYVKPLIQNLDIVGKEDRKDNIFQQMWEVIAGTASEVFENQEKDQVATKIPFEGKIEDPDTNVWYAIVSVLRNAFVQAIQPSIDQEINIASVENTKEEKKTFLQKVFGKKDKERDSGKDKTKEDDKQKKKSKAD